MTRFVLAGLLSIATFGSGCDSVDSAMVETSEMGLYVDAEVDASGRLEVLAQLTTDNDALLESTYVRLSDGDRLFAAVDGDTRELREQFVIGLGTYQYVTEFEHAPAGQRLIVSLDRIDREEAPRSRVTLPEPFDVVLADETFTMQAGVTLRWSGAPDRGEVGVSLASACVELVDAPTAPASAGQLRIPPTRLRYVTGADPAQSCPVSFTLRLAVAGQVDPAFGRGGSITATQVRDAAMTIGPSAP
jgi:hypothetical protein